MTYDLRRGPTRRAAIGLLAGAAFAGAAAAQTPPAAAKTIDHSAWDGLLAAYVVKGADGLNRVAYGKFKGAGHAKLKAYIKTLEAADVAALDRSEQFAFWANLYNAKTIDVVLDKYPVKSIKDVSLGGGLKSLVGGGPWQAKIMTVGGKAISLDDIENVMMRPVFKDPRVHYAVNCASVGCPNLQAEAFTGAKLDAMLEAGAKAFVNSPRGIRVEGGVATASSIYDWFKADFGGDVLGHMKKYAEPALKAKLERLSGIGSYDYDWSLADAK
jgi:hypothetical protein